MSGLKQCEFYFNIFQRILIADAAHISQELFEDSADVMSMLRGIICICQRSLLVVLNAYIEQRIERGGTQSSKDNILGSNFADS